MTVKASRTKIALYPHADSLFDLSFGIQNLVELGAAGFTRGHSEIRIDRNIFQNLSTYERGGNRNLLLSWVCFHSS